jgi:hypothetical protein
MIVLSGFIKSELDKYWKKYKEGKLALSPKH